MKFARQLVLWGRTEWWWLSYLTIGGLAFIVFLILQASPVFSDPDSFYHAKMAVLIRDRGIIHDFPWLDLTVLGENYTDQHLLYHVILIPFVTWLPPLIGIKLATVFFAALLALTAYWLLRQAGVRWAFWFVVILIFIRPFVFRMMLAKAPSTSLIFLFLGLGWMFNYHLRRLAGLAFTYVWYYGGFALLGVAAVTYATISTIYNKFARIHAHQWVNKIFALVGRHARRQRSLRLDLWLVIAVAGGTAAGVIINPYFPANLTFYLHQLINIGIINFRNVIGVGGEWYPYGLSELLAGNAFGSLLMLVAVAAMVIRWRRLSKQTLALAVLTIFFFVLTLKSRRYVEYYVPFTMLFSAFSLNDSFGHGAQPVWQEFKRLLLRQNWARWTLGLIAATILFGVGYIAARDTIGNWRDLRQGIPADRFANVSRWLENNTPPLSRVVHSDWDEFPVLFYHNSHNTYIVGLDPTFLYKADQDRYWTWVDITLGRYSGDVYRAVTETLDSRYVLIETGHTAMTALVSNNPNFELRYQDDEAAVYEAGTEPL